MGNCPGCLSNRGSLQVHDHPGSLYCNAEDEELITTARRNTQGDGDQLVKHHTRLSNQRKPLLRPSLKLLQQSDYTHDLHKQEAKTLNPKPDICSKKVRFCDEPELITYLCIDEETALSSSFNGDLQALSHKKQSSVVLDDGCRSEPRFVDVAVDAIDLAVDAIPSARSTRQDKSFNGVVRLKVMISKKDLTELMSFKTTEKQAGAMVERIIAPLLSPQQYDNVSTNSCSRHCSGNINASS